jgi:hypothetical protein
MLRVVIYGWAIPDDKFRGPGSGTFVDLVYFVDEGISVREILDAINMSGFKFVPFRYQGQVVQDKVSIDEIDIGIEPVEEPVQTLSQDELQQGGYYGRY